MELSAALGPLECMVGGENRGSAEWDSSAGAQSFLGPAQNACPSRWTPVRNVCILLTMSALTEQILRLTSSRSEGEVISPREFLHLAGRAAVDQALSRLARQGKLMRVTRGAYVAPVVGRFGSRPPSPEKTVRSLAEKNGEVVVAHGAAAANALGLTTQVPSREVFVTSGRNRRLSFGSRVVELKHAPRWQLALGERPAGAAVRALAWLGPQHARESLVNIRKRFAPVEWAALTKSRSALPSWMAQAVGEANSAANG